MATFHFTAPLTFAESRRFLVPRAILRVHQRWEALTFTGRAVGQMPAYFKRQTAPALRPSARSSSGTTAASERRDVSSHTESSSPSWQWVKWSDKGGIKEKKRPLSRPPFKKSLDQTIEVNTLILCPDQCRTRFPQKKKTKPRCVTTVTMSNTCRI